MSFFTVKWDDADGGTVVLLDQTLLPEREEYLRCREVPQVIDAIRTYREQTGVGLKDAKDVVDQLRARSS